MKAMDKSSGVCSGEGGVGHGPLALTHSPPDIAFLCQVQEKLHHVNESFPFISDIAWLVATGRHNHIEIQLILETTAFDCQEMDR